MKGISLQLSFDPGVDMQESLEAVAEGLVERNRVFFDTHDLTVDIEQNGLIAYENPRMSQGYQTLSDAPNVLKRGRATCMDWAALVAGYLRSRKGVHAKVVIEPEPSVYGQFVDDWHAFVYSDQGGLVDVCTLLRGYGSATEETFAAVGAGHACCLDCVYDGTLLQAPACEACALAGSTAHPRGGCQHS